MNSNDVNVNLVSDWLIELNCQPIRVVMWNDPIAKVTPYRTHLEVMGEDTNCFILGHYDLSLGQAIDDFKERCHQHGIIIN